MEIDQPTKTPTPQSKKGHNWQKIVFALVLILLPFFAFYAGMKYQESQVKQTIPAVNSFEECLETLDTFIYPEVCIAPDGSEWPAPTDTTSASEIVEFEGILTDFIEDCAFDGQCIAVVDDYQIVVAQGLVPDPPPSGSYNINSEDIGSKVKVKAQVVERNQLTIIGSETYYVNKPSATGAIDDLPTFCEKAGGTWLEEFNECEYASKDFCDSMNGIFYMCESACRHNPEMEFCTEQCVPVCVL